MSLCTRCVRDCFASHLPTRTLNLSVGVATTNRWRRVRKAGKAAVAALSLATRRARPGDVLYMPANSAGGIRFNLWAARAALARGLRVLLHHHVYYYLEKKDPQIARLDDMVTRSGGAHAFLCAGMEARFREVYGSTAASLIVPSTILLGDEPPREEAAVRPAADHAEPFRIGYLSNLCYAKGTDFVGGLMDQLREQGRHVSLIVAGPAVDADAEAWLEELRARHGSRVDYRGPVYDQDKRRFFQDIDVFLLPSRSEAQPVVISEALAYGKPVIAFGRGCIPGLLGNNQGWSIPPDGDFVKTGCDLIVDWIQSPASYQHAQRDSLARARELRSEAQDALNRLVEWASSPPGPSRRACGATTSSPLPH
ncbi:MAG: glycosyltransferase family 4 protein [Planctomycetales bacterium]|nr:glycosyltransferase family 4 protein [Planctomycetales bacterium]